MSYENLLAKGIYAGVTDRHVRRIMLETTAKVIMLWNTWKSAFGGISLEGVNHKWDFERIFCDQEYQDMIDAILAKIKEARDAELVPKVMFPKAGEEIKTLLKYKGKFPEPCDPVHMHVIAIELVVKDPVLRNLLIARVLNPGAAGDIDAMAFAKGVATDYGTRYEFATGKLIDILGNEVANPVKQEPATAHWQMEIAQYLQDTKAERIDHSKPWQEAPSHWSFKYFFLNLKHEGEMIWAQRVHHWLAIRDNWTQFVKHKPDTIGLIGLMLEETKLIRKMRMDMLQLGYNCVLFQDKIQLLKEPLEGLQSEVTDTHFSAIVECEGRLRLVLVSAEQLKAIEGLEYHVYPSWFGQF